MLGEDVIEPYSSPWASPVALGKKKNGFYRFCVGYRKVKDSYPLPSIDDTLDYLAKVICFSTLNLSSIYWQGDLLKNPRKILLL